jgi:hypothetical protein
MPFIPNCSSSTTWGQLPTINDDDNEIFFKKIHPNENIERHCLQLELISIQIQLNLDEIEFKNIEWNSTFIELNSNSIGLDSYLIEEK